MEWKPDICIYHFPCDDGFASAWIVRKKWPDVLLVQTNYGLPLPDIEINGKNILIADFSYKAVELHNMIKQAKSIVVLDHHKTAEADLKEFKTLTRLSNKNCPGNGIVAYFDLDHSGAALTWEFCFDDPMPIMLQFIEDRDLFRFKLKETRAFSLYLRSFPYNMEVWDRIAEQIDNDTNMIIGQALAIERFYNQRLADMVPTATLRTIGNWKDVPVVHAPYAFASDLAHQLLSKYPEAPFATVVVDAYGQRTWSLRSEDSRQDVSEVAKQFGGGGHRNAAGFRTPI